MSISGALISDTGNGPCIELELNDGTHAIISNVDGSGMPTVDSWCVGRCDKNEECIDIWSSKDTDDLWRDEPRDPNKNTSECTSLIISEMIKWGNDAFDDGMNAYDTWKLMMNEMEFNLDYLSVKEISLVKAILSEIIDKP